MRRQSDIPSIVAGPFADIVDSVWAGERLAEYLLAPAARRQVWHAWLAMKAEAASSDPDGAYGRLSRASGRDLLAEAYGQAPAGMVRALGRLGPVAQPPDVYRGVAAVLVDGDPGAKLIRHAASLDEGFVRVLWTLPKSLRRKPIVDYCHVGEARFLNWLVRAAGYGETELPPSLLAQLQSRRGRHGPADVIQAFLAPENFAAPPFAAPAPLTPIASLAQLRAAAKRFRNCLEHYGEEAMSGARSFYVWDGSEPAVVGLSKVGDLGWRVGEIAGVDNADVSAATRAAIADALAPFGNVFIDDLSWRAPPLLTRHPEFRAA